MQVNNSQPSFGSTLIKNAGKLPVHSNKYVDVVEQYFSISKTGMLVPKGFDNPQKVANKIDFSTYAIAVKDGNIKIIGKDGGDGGADTFIGKILKKAFPNDDIEYIDDIAPVKVDGPVIDMTEIGKILDSEV